MAQTAITIRTVKNCPLPATHHSQNAHQHASSEINITSISRFRATLIAMMIAAPVWASIAYILSR